ncbi:hypothetical protein LXA43DRAFT_980789, partial [Ganoderma leucocontextum]
MLCHPIICQADTNRLRKTRLVKQRPATVQSVRKTAPRSQFCPPLDVSLTPFRTGCRYALTTRMQSYTSPPVQSTACDIRSSDERLHRLPIYPPHDAASFDFLQRNARIVQAPYFSSHALSDRHVQPRAAVGPPPACKQPGIAICVGRIWTACSDPTYQMTSGVLVSSALTARGVLCLLTALTLLVEAKPHHTVILKHNCGLIV